MTSSSSTTTKGGLAYSSSTTGNTYVWRDSLAISYSAISNAIVGGASTFYHTEYTYTTAGTLASAWIADGVSRGVGYVSDTLGQVIIRDEGTIAPHEKWYRFGGKQLGYISNNGTLETSYETSITNRTTAPVGSGLYQNGATTPTAYADFDQSLDPINSYSQGGAGGSYTAKGGETLAALASQIWGDASLWYKIAAANGMTGSATLAAGQVIAIPGGVMRSTNNASTFQPYDAVAAMGDTSPTTPSPPAPQKASKKGCGTFGIILMIVVAVAVAVAAIAGPAIIGATAAASSTGAATGLTAILGGSAAVAGSAGTIAAGVIGGALAGAAGSIASQVVGLATNTISKFSFKDVAIAAISGGVGGGLGSIPGLNGATGLLGVAQDAARGALGSALTQGIAVATRLQKKFDFVGVATAGVSAGVSGGIGLHGPLGNAISGVAGGIAGAATRSVLTGTDFGDNLMAALPDIIGNTIGGLVAGGIQGAFGRPLDALERAQVKAQLARDKARAIDVPASFLTDEQMFENALQSKPLALFDQEDEAGRERGIASTPARIAATACEINLPGISQMAAEAVKLSLSSAKRDLTEAARQSAPTDQDGGNIDEETGEIVVVGQRSKEEEEIVVRGYGSSYRVANGEHLSKIAALWGVRYEELMEINKIADPKTLQEGRRLLMPLYTVRTGDTVDNLADRFHTTSGRIIELNNLDGKEELVPGAKLVIEATGQAVARARVSHAPRREALAPLPPTVGWRPGGRLSVRAVERHADHAMDQYNANIAWGMDPDSAAAWAAASELESGGDPRARQRPGPGRGMYQWDPTDSRGIQFQRVIGVPLTGSTREQQFRFRDWELAGPERSAARHIARAQGPGDRAAAITRYYERPAATRPIAQI